MALGVEVAALLGQADVGQTVVVRNGHVLALEAVEGTDETIRRGGKLGGKGAVVVKRCKPGQDLRFDLPAAGPRTLEVMREVGAKVLALEAGRTVLLDAPQLFTGRNPGDYGGASPGGGRSPGCQAPPGPHSLNSRAVLPSAPWESLCARALLPSPGTPEVAAPMNARLLLLCLALASSPALAGDAIHVSLDCRACRWARACPR